MNHRRIQSAAGFTLIEVVVAVAALVAVGVAMTVLGNNALRLVDAAELKTTAGSLNEESLTVVSLLRRTDNQFETTLGNLGCTSTGGCYVDCPTTPLDHSCQLTNTVAAVNLGENHLRFVRQIHVTIITGPPKAYVVTATVSWGAGANRQTSASLRLD